MLTPSQCSKDEGTVQEAAETLARHVHLNILLFLMCHLKLGILTLVWTLPHAEPVPAAGVTVLEPRAQHDKVWPRVGVGGPGALGGSDVADGLQQALDQPQPGKTSGEAWHGVAVPRSLGCPP